MAIDSNDFFKDKFIIVHCFKLKKVNKNILYILLKFFVFN
jgi:hypothetical protein